eukprot:TRINITY_DN22941_c0_g1_i1.p1 TRINITY_DN22941_c0_g1~~TRINITY_DN22941_c0_g1_i1.p1  ORF type:complete len:425 (+),score=124.45 TRINITY_DN22941_c0_g1_i1:52-1275(+)
MTVYTPRGQAIAGLRRQTSLQHSARYPGVPEKVVEARRKAWREQYRPKRSTPEDKLFRDFELLRQPAAHYNLVRGEIEHGVTRVHTRIQQLMLRVWQRTMLQRRICQSASLTTTHFNFGSSATAVLVLNDNPIYRYGRLIVNEADVLLYDSTGATGTFARSDINAVVDGLTRAIKDARQKQSDDSLDPAASAAGEVPEADTCGDVFNFADAGEELDEVPANPGGKWAMDWMASTVTAPHDRELALAKSLMRMGEAEEIEDTQLVRPLVACMFCPAAHGTLPMAFLEHLPPSSYWDLESLRLGQGQHAEGSRLLRRWDLEYGQVGSPKLLTGRSAFPPPPSDFTQLEPKLNGRRAYGIHESQAHWSGHRATYSDRPWQPRWNLGWTPQKAAALRTGATSSSSIAPQQT